MHESEAEIETPLHSARVAAHLAVGRIGESNTGEQLVGPAVALGAIEPVKPRLQAHVLAPGQEGVERGLLQRSSDRTPHVGALAHDVVARDAGCALGRRQERGEHEDGRRLARAVRSEEPVDLAGRDLEVDPVDRSRALLEDPDQALDFDAVRLSHGRAR